MLMVRSFGIHENKYLRGERDSESGARDSNAGWDLHSQSQLTRATNVSATEFHKELLIRHLQVKNYEQEISV